MLIGFSTAKSNPFSWVIRKLTRSKASHCFVITNLYKQDLVIQSGDFGVGFDYLQRFMKKNRIVAKFQVPVPDENKAMEFVMSEMGVSYNYLGLIGAGWVVVMRMFGKKVSNPLTQKGQVFCSQFIVKALCAGGKQEYCSLDSATVSPEDLIERFNKDNNIKAL